MTPTENESSTAGSEAPVAERSHRLIEEPMDLFMVSLSQLPTSYVLKGFQKALTVSRQPFPSTWSGL